MNIQKEHSSHDHSTHEGHNHDNNGGNYIPSIISLSLLLLGLVFEHISKLSFFKGWVLVTL